MSELESIKPSKNQRIYDLVREAGIDVSDWSNFKGGVAKAASNPRYCYDWSFVQAGKVVVLNLWFESMEVRDGRIVQDLDMRRFAASLRDLPYKGAIIKRAMAMDEALQLALGHQLPIKVVVCDGRQRYPDDPDSSASLVEKRHLDPVSWGVIAYDWKTGSCTVARGDRTPGYIDQFESREPISSVVEKVEKSGFAYSRSPLVRERVLVRAAGYCEWCGERGFPTADGRLYLETHHIEPLSKGGEDSEKNVAALCANHHREAHSGQNRAEMAKELHEKVGRMYA